MKKEYRVYVKGFRKGQGHYIIAKNKAEAISIDKKNGRKGELDAELWKKGKDIYSLKLTPLARKRMKLNA